MVAGSVAIRLAPGTRLRAMARPKNPVTHGLEVKPHVEWQPMKVA